MAPMMRLVLGLGVLVLILSVVALGLPAHVTATRSVVINAPEYAIYPYVNSVRSYQDWAPWAINDPKIKMTYSGPAEGNGATAEWVSEVPSVGNGSIRIVETKEPNNLTLATNIKGLEGTSYFDLSPEGAGSKVTWSFGFDTGSSPLKRWKGLILDGYIGEVYEDGLEKLKEVVEASRAPVTPAPAPAAPVVEEAPAAEAGGESDAPEEEAPAEQP